MSASLRFSLGAGISVQAGIPDFRSPEGLFQTLKRDNPRESLASGKDLFDASVFNVSVSQIFEKTSRGVLVTFYRPAVFGAINSRGTAYGLILIHNHSLSTPHHYFVK